MLDSGQVNVSDGKFEFKGSSSIASHPSAESSKVWLVGWLYYLSIDYTYHIFPHWKLLLVANSEGWRDTLEQLCKYTLDVYREIVDHCSHKELSSCIAELWTHYNDKSSFEILLNTLFPTLLCTWVPSSQLIMTKSLLVNSYPLVHLYPHMYIYTYLVWNTLMAYTITVEFSFCSR